MLTCTQYQEEYSVLQSHYVFKSGVDIPSATESFLFFV